MPLPKVDIILAAVAATPAAIGRVALTTHPNNGSVRFFLEPIIEFNWSDHSVFLTAPDTLALVSSLVLVVRFISWAILPILNRKKGRKGD